MDQEKQTLKKENSYTYWVDNNPLFKDTEKKEYKPEVVKNKDEHIQQEKRIQEDINKNKASAWNSAQIWETRKLKTEDLFKFLVEKVNGKGVFTSGLDVELLEIIQIKGTCDVVCVRGKQKLGYDLEVEVKVQGVGINIDQQAQVTFQMMDDGDREYKHIDTQHQHFRQLVINSVQQIGDVLNMQLKTMFNQ